MLVSCSSTKDGPGLERLLRAVAAVLPGELSSFSAARYGLSHHIVPHDDRAYTEATLCPFCSSAAIVRQYTYGKR